MNSAAIAKPIARTLGGIVSDSAAKMPGTSSDDSPDTRMFIAIAMPRFGASANTIQQPAIARADDREHAQAEAGVAQHEPRRERDAEEDRDDLRGLRERGDDAALESPRSKTCS